MRVAVVVGTADAHPGECTHQAARRLLFGSVIPGTPGVDHHHLHVRDTALSKGSLEFLVVFEQMLTLKKLVQHDRWLYTRNMLPGGDFVCCEVHDSLVCCAVGVVEQLDKGLARHSVTFFEGEYNVLWRLMESHRDKADLITELTFFANKSDCGTKLFGCQRL